MKIHDAVEQNTRCPFCGHPHELASGVDTDCRPHPGAFSICINCAQVGVYDERVQIRKPMPEEQAIIDASPEIAKVRRGIGVVRAKEWN